MFFFWFVCYQEVSPVEYLSRYQEVLVINTFCFLLFVCAFNRVLFSFLDGVVVGLFESEVDEDDDAALVMRR